MTERTNTGFTLIELLLVLAIMMLLAVSSYVGFTQFNKGQIMTSASDTLRNTLQEARSYTSSQVIRTSTCKAVGRTLVGHQISFGSRNYALVEVCTQAGNTYSEQIKNINLPSGISFSPVPAPVQFQIITGAVLNAGTITVSNGSQTRSITVDPVTGVIR